MQDDIVGSHPSSTDTDQPTGRFARSRVAGNVGDDPT
jgi:hypothetical protein